MALACDRDDEVLADWHAHHNAEQGAARLGMHVQTYRKLLDRNGIDAVARLAAKQGRAPQSTLPLKTDAQPTRREAAQAFMPEPAPEAGGLSLPEPITLSYDPVHIDMQGHAGILSDAHIPYHDKQTIEHWIRDCKQRNASTLILNGDILDCGEVSTHFRFPSETRLEEEIESGIQFLRYLRSQFPQSRIVYKSGNHEDRLPRYLANNAEAVLNFVSLPKLLEMDNVGVEWVTDKRIVMLGKLPVLHGHEFRGGGGVNPARWLFLRTGSTAMCGHFHRTSEHHEQTLDRKIHGTWSTGCATYLHPQYDPTNKWNHGYALVEVAQGGHFSVTNRRLMRDGRLV